MNRFKTNQKEEANNARERERERCQIRALNWCLCHLIVD